MFVEDSDVDPICPIGLTCKKSYWSTKDVYKRTNYTFQIGQNYTKPCFSLKVGFFITDFCFPKFSKF